LLLVDGPHRAHRRAEQRSVIRRTQTYPHPMKIAPETPRQPEVIAMLDQLDAYCASLYPAESNHLMGVDSLVSADVVFLVARDETGKAVGCAACVKRGAYGEVKRMFVDPEQRGQGIGAKLLAEIVLRAGGAGLRGLQLETGISQPEAIALYERARFRRCPPFGDYQPDPLSIFMERPL
jgi:putative acetyltransferase